MKTFAIARLTFAVERHRPEVLILVLIGFCLTLFMSVIFLNPDLTQQIMGSIGSVPSSRDNTLMLQGGLFYGEICLYLIAFLVGMNGFFGDFKSGIMDIVLARPLPRTQYLLGKFLGMLAVCALAHLVIILPVLGVSTAQGLWNVLGSTALFYLFSVLKVVIYLSLTVFFLMRVPRLIAPLVGLVFIGVGYFSDNIAGIKASLEGFINWLYTVSYYLVPHLTEVTVATVFDPGWRVIDYTVWVLAYGILYPGIFLGLAIVLFKRKSL